MPDTSNRLLTRKDIIEILHVSISTIKRMENEGVLVGVVGPGRTKLYLASDVELLKDRICNEITEKKSALNKQVVVE